MRVEDDLHLTYCTNIHPASGWHEVREQVDRCATELRRRLGADEPFGVGLRLSDAEARELLEGDRLESFGALLEERGLYVFTINGFPYGAFHGERIKDDVHRPDWRTDERVAYTKRLAEILAALAPEGVEPGISTNPLTYRHWKGVETAESMDQMVGGLVEVVVYLVRLRERGGPLVHLDVEPEPDGLLETTAELVEFFEGRMFEDGAERLAERCGRSKSRATEAMRRHLRMCLDTCHAAVQFESAESVVDRLEEAGVRIGKVQVSSALDLELADRPEERVETRRALEPFDEPVYLHQVVQRNRDGTFESFRDLGSALEAIDRPEAERWRIHFHVPVYRRAFEGLGSTRATIVEALDELEERRYTNHLEIETYTWDVLPDDEKLDLVDSIEREYEWVLDVLD